MENLNFLEIENEALVQALLLHVRFPRLKDTRAHVPDKLLSMIAARDTLPAIQTLAVSTGRRRRVPHDLVHSFSADIAQYRFITHLLIQAFFIRGKDLEGLAMGCSSLQVLSFNICLFEEDGILKRLIEQRSATGRLMLRELHLIQSAGFENLDWIRMNVGVLTGDLDSG